MTAELMVCATTAAFIAAVVIIHTSYVETELTYARNSVHGISVKFSKRVHAYIKTRRHRDPQSVAYAGFF